MMKGGAENVNTKNIKSIRGLLGNGSNLIKDKLSKKRPISIPKQSVI